MALYSAPSRPAHLPSWVPGFSWACQVYWVPGGWAHCPPSPASPLIAAPRVPLPVPCIPSGPYHLFGVGLPRTETCSYIGEGGPELRALRDGASSKSEGIRRQHEPVCGNATRAPQNHTYTSPPHTIGARGAESREGRDLKAKGTRNGPLYITLCGIDNAVQCATLRTMPTLGASTTRLRVTPRQRASTVLGYSP